MPVRQHGSTPMPAGTALDLAILQQKADNDTWALIQAGSCFLTDAESWYAIIELELLPIYHKVQDVFGCPTTLQGHH